MYNFFFSFFLLIEKIETIAWCKAPYWFLKKWKNTVRSLAADLERMSDFDLWLRIQLFPPLIAHHPNKHTHMWFAQFGFYQFWMNTWF